MTFKAREREKNDKIAGSIARLLAPDTNRAKATDSAATALEDIEDHFALLCGTYVTDSKMRARLRRLSVAIAGVAAPWNEMLKEAQVFPFAAPVKILEEMDDFLAFGRLCGKVVDETGKETQKKPDIDAAMKVKAAELAFRLVKQHGLKPSSKVDSEYCQIAKLLHGGGDKLTKQCKTYAEAQSAVRAKRQAKKARS